MKRITATDLQFIVNSINRVTNSPSESYTKDGVGKCIACIGNYYINFAYGGSSLHRIMSEGGGISDVFNSGHMSKRELYERMQAYLLGIESNQGSI